MSSMDYFDHEADIGIIGKGKTLVESFIGAAEAVFSIMTDLQQVKPLQKIHIEFDEADIELALVTWLNSLITQARCNGLIFSKFELTQKKDHWIGNAWGDFLTNDTIRGTEVKGATLTMLSVKQNNHLWEARCVVDV